MIPLEVATLGQTIRRLRQQKAWTIAKLAAEAAVSHAFVTAVERGKRIPHTPTLLRLLAALDHPAAAVPVAAEQRRAALVAALLES